MDIEDAIYEILKADAGVIAVVSGRIFGGVIRETLKTFPVVMYKSDGGRKPIRTLQGGCSLVSQRIRVFSAAPGLSVASDVDYAVHAALDEFRGTVGNGASPEETIEVQSIYSQPLSHDHEYVDKTELHQFVSDFDCHFIDPRRIPTP